MPPVRSPHKSVKPLSESAKFALALGLQDRLETFKSIKEVLRRLADDSFNFDLPLFQQMDALTTFVEKAVSQFPGHFNASHENNKERLNLLQKYAFSYLSKSGKLATSNTGRARSKSRVPKPPSSPPQLLPDAKLPVLKMIKVERPKPNVNGMQQSMTTPKARRKPFSAPAPPVCRSKSTPGPASPRKPPSAPARVLAGTSVEGHPHNTRFARARALESVGASEMQAPVVVDYDGDVDMTLPDDAVEENPADGLPVVEPPEDESLPANVSAAVTEFLSKCTPPMTVCAPAFLRAGITKQSDLEGLACWGEESLRKFLWQAEVGKTPLEVETLILGIHPNDEPRRSNPPTSIAEFLVGCTPPMTACAAAVWRSGIRQPSYLSYMANWGEKRLRTFVEKQVGGTPLQIETLFRTVQAFAGNVNST